MHNYCTICGSMADAGVHTEPFGRPYGFVFYTHRFVPRGFDD